MIERDLIYPPYKTAPLPPAVFTPIEVAGAVVVVPDKYASGGIAPLACDLSAQDSYREDKKGGVK